MDYIDIPGSPLCPGWYTVFRHQSLTQNVVGFADGSVESASYDTFQQAGVDNPNYWTTPLGKWSQLLRR